MHLCWYHFQMLTNVWQAATLVAVEFVLTLRDLLPVIVLGLGTLGTRVTQVRQSL